MRLILTPAMVAIAAGAGLAVTAPASSALAQGMRMDCFGGQGGRMTCVESRDVLFDRLDQKARERRTAERRDRKLVWKVAQAVHDGRCDEAMTLAMQASDRTIAANTARLCGVPEAASDKTTPLS